MLSVRYLYYHVLLVIEGERISLKDIKDFSLTLWLVFFVCVFYYVTVFPFIGLASYVATPLN